MTGFHVQTAGGRTIPVPAEAIAAAMCGAYVSRLIREVGGKMEDFRFHYYRQLKWHKAVANSLSRYTSIPQLIEAATAKIWDGNEND